MKKLPLNVLEDKARVMTKEALKACEIPDDMKAFLQMRLQADEWIFELCYFSNGETEEAVPIAETRINVYTGEGMVKTFLPSKKH
jgi:hypothetical protein